MVGLTGGVFCASANESIYPCHSQSEARSRQLLHDWQVGPPSELFFAISLLSYSIAVCTTILNAFVNPFTTTYPLFCPTLSFNAHALASGVPPNTLFLYSAPTAYQLLLNSRPFRRWAICRTIHDESDSPTIASCFCLTPTNAPFVRTGEKLNTFN